MPAVPKNDANLALQEGRFSDWKNSLIEVPELFQISETGTNKTEVISEENSLRIIKASDVEIRPIKWLWSGVMALGKLIILSGEPGLGKSQVSLFVASVVSKGGYWPVTNGQYVKKAASAAFFIAQIRPDLCSPAHPAIENS